MNCPRCNTDTLRVTHTFPLANCTIRTSECTKCKHKFTVHQAILCEVKERGDGAITWINRLASGAVAVSLEVTEPASTATPTSSE